MGLFTKKKPSVKTKSKSPIPVHLGYDAATTHRRTARHWMMADNLSANAANSKSVRQTLVSKSRYEYFNNTYCYGMINSYAEWIVGTGARLNILNVDESLAKDLEYLYAEYAKYIKLVEKLMISITSSSRDGEIFGLMINNEKNLKDISIGLDIFLMETERITSSFMDGKSMFSNVTSDNIDGVIIDKFGNPIDYQVLVDHPGDTDVNNIKNFGKVKKYKAENMIHLFKPRRAEQYRGIPDITPALELYGILRDYTNATLTAAQTAANIAAVLETPDIPDDSTYTTETDTEVPDNNFDQLQINMGMMTVLPNGNKLNQLKPEQPTTAYPEFEKRIINAEGRVLNMPMNIASGSSEGYNYASGRLDHQSFIRTVELERKYLVDKFLDKHFNAFFNELTLLPEHRAMRNQFKKKTSIYRNSTPDRTWFFDGVPHVDPAKEANAFDTNFSNGSGTLARHYGKLGLDWREEVTQWVKERAEIDAITKKEQETTNGQD